MAEVLRILDANANRAREALRVMEEAARFILDDRELSGIAKSMRHDLAIALRPVEGAIFHRDTPGDVGVTIKASDEFSRAGVADVAIAAGKRLSEALRAIEEFAKTLGPTGVAEQVEALRYRGYTLEQRLNVALGCGRRRQWRLCVLITEALCRHHDWREVARQAVAAGADCVQLREKQLEGGELLGRARALVSIARPAGAAVIINDRPDVALMAEADGVHVGQGDLPCAEVRGLVGRRLLIGVSTSRLEEAESAWRDGADYCGVGPMFTTTTKHKEVIVGPAYLRQYVQWGRLPHLAIGGVAATNVAELVEVGGQGVAVSSAVCGAEDPGEAVRKILEPLGDAGRGRKETEPC